MYNLIVGGLINRGESSTFSPIPTKLTGAKVLSMKTCKIEECNNQARKRDMCNKHYLRWWRYKDTSFVKFHYQTNSRTYRSWNHMKQRCLNPNNDAYKDYGERGITVCNRWLDFKNFYADMGDRPEGKELDRKDNDKGYYKENCRWATAAENVQNRRITKLTPEKVKAIRSLYPSVPQRTIAKQYNISQMMVSLIVNNKQWKI